MRNMIKVVFTKKKTGKVIASITWYLDLHSLNKFKMSIKLYVIMCVSANLAVCSFLSTLFSSRQKDHCDTIEIVCKAVFKFDASRNRKIELKQQETVLNVSLSIPCTLRLTYHMIGRVVFHLCNCYFTIIFIKKMITKIIVFD